MYSFEDTYSHNVIRKEWVKNMQWGPVQGPAGFRTADGTWIPNLGTTEIALKSEEGFPSRFAFAWPLCREPC